MVARRFWDLHSQGWDKMRSQPTGQLWIAGALDLLTAELEGGGAVLDLGCGPGHHAVGLAERGFTVTAVDYSSSMLELARTRARQAGIATVTFVEADLNRPLPLPAESFDGALCISVLQVIDDPAEFAREVARTLRPGGRLLVEVGLRRGALSRDSTLTGADRALNIIKQQAARLPGALLHFDPPQLGGLVEEAGLAILTAEQVGARYLLLAQRP